MIGGAFLATIALTLALGVDRPLPPIALDTAVVFHIERALVIFYGALLIALPLVKGVLHGELPIEISPRGARYREAARESEEAAKPLRETVAELGQAMHESSDTIEELAIRVQALEEALSRIAGERGV